MIFLGKAELVAEYDDWEVHSARDIFPAPAVLRLLKYNKLGPKWVKFSRENIYLRDNHVCQYCGNKFPSRKLTLDHVQPSSRGGKTTWTNIVSACLPCNSDKADMTPSEAKMPLLNHPVMPNGRHPATRSYLSRGNVPDEWVAWIH
jgi:5-methylcytosine-specific restriction endonuclease McrA